MAKIDRFDGNVKAFASSAVGTERTVFGDTSQSDTLDANVVADFFRGWGITGPAFNPTKQDFNGLAFTLGQLIAYLHQQGIPEWNTSQEYYRGSVVTTLAGIYRLKNGGNATVDPDNDNGTNWELAPTRAQVDAKANQATTYTETEVDGLLDDKADKATTYTETEVDNLLDAKADQATTYTETEVDSLLNAKANLSGATFAGNISATNLSGTNTGDQTLNEIGVGQTWQNVKSSRSLGINYTNSTGKPISVSVSSVGNASTIGLKLIVDGVSVVENFVSSTGSGQKYVIVSAIVPNGAVYKVNQINSVYIGEWAELR
jgi:hypothetical protein